MKLEDFICETLLQVANGIKQAQAQSKEHKMTIVPSIILHLPRETMYSTIKQANQSIISNSILSSHRRKTQNRTALLNLV